MTTYAQDEESQAGSAPVEAYEFIGSATTWRYTSAIAAVTIDGNTYNPLAGLIRGARAQGTLEASPPTLVVTLPIAAQVVQHYGFQTPPRSLQLKVYRYQATSGEYVTDWDGDVTSIVPKDNLIAEVKVPSRLGARLATSIPSLTIRPQCPHGLYDARCRVARASFDLAATVSNVNATDARIITISGVGGNPDQWFRAGEIVRDSDGERRSIVDQVGAVIKVVAPFRTLANGNAVTLYAGCDHTRQTCVDKFANLANFGGFPTVPGFNPFRLPIATGGS